MLPMVVLPFVDSVRFALQVTVKKQLSKSFLLKNYFSYKLLLSVGFKVSASGILLSNQ